jgi:hypothetical protein
MSQEIKNPETQKHFIFAGNSTFTLRSVKTGRHFTFKISRADGENDDRPWFVKVLAGADNTTDYRFVGTIFPTDLGIIRQGRNGMNPTAPSAVAISWFIRNIGNSGVQFFHEDRCAHCGRKLTAPESIATGFGPDCAAKLGIDIVRLAYREECIDNAYLDRSEEQDAQQLTLDEVLA